MRQLRRCGPGNAVRTGGRPGRLTEGSARSPRARLRRRVAPVVLAGLALAAASVRSNQAEPSLAGILDRYPVGGVICDYTALRKASDQPSTTERFVAGRGWTLLSIDDRSPTFEELVEYETDASAAVRALRSHPDDFSIAGMIVADDAVLASEDAETLTYVFEPRMADLFEDAPPGAALRGTLVIARPEFAPASILIELVESASPDAAPVRLDEQREWRTFTVDQATGALLVETYEMTSNGRAFFIREVMNSLTVGFSDFNCRRAQAG